MKLQLAILFLTSCLHAQTAMCDFQKSAVHDLNIPKGQSLFVCRIDLKNHGAGFVNALTIVVDGDVTDNSSGISIQNDGRSDALYIGVNGKRGQPSGPTGLAIDVNRLGNTRNENSPQNRGIGIQAWDWSRTNQGAEGPKGFYYQKVNNLNSDHIPIHIRSNSQGLLIETPEGPGYAGFKNVIVVQNDVPGNPEQKFRVTANGDVYSKSLSVAGGWPISSTSNVTQYVGTIATTSSRSDHLPVRGIAPSSHCQAQPTNELASTTSNWTSTETGEVVLHHSGVPGATFAIFCSFN